MNDHAPTPYRWSLRTMLLAITLFSLGFAFGCAFVRAAPGRSPIALLWIALGAPSMVATGLIDSFDVFHSDKLGTIFMVCTGALYGVYALLFLLPRRFAYIALGLHFLSIPVALLVAMTNC